VLKNLKEWAVEFLYYNPRRSMLIGLGWGNHVQLPLILYLRKHCVEKCVLRLLADLFLSGFWSKPKFFRHWMECWFFIFHPLQPLTCVCVAIDVVVNATSNFTKWQLLTLGYLFMSGVTRFSISSKQAAKELWFSFPLLLYNVRDKF